MESEESERFHFLLTLLMTPFFSFRSSENQIVGVGSKRGSINQSQFTFPRFVIGLVRLLLLATPTTQFSLDRKRRSRRRNQNAVFTRWQSLTLLTITTPTPTLSVAREKQPSYVLIWKHTYFCIKSSAKENSGPLSIFFRLSFSQLSCVHNSDDFSRMEITCNIFFN